MILKKNNKEQTNVNDKDLIKSEQVLCIISGIIQWFVSLKRYGLDIADI